MADFLTPEERQQESLSRRAELILTYKGPARKIALVLFAIVDLILVSVGAWGFIDAFLISYQAEQQTIVDTANSGLAGQAITASRTATSLSLGRAYVLDSGAGKYDYYTTVENLNADWWAEFTYEFTSSAGTLEQTGYVLPSETRPPVAFAVEAQGKPTSLGVSITNVSWHRVDRHEVGDYTKWSTDRLRLAITDSTYEPNITLGTEVIAKSTFTVANNTAYGYWSPRFFVVMYRGSTPAAVNATSIMEFEPGDVETIDLTWFSPPQGVNKQEIITDVNIFDPEAYMPLTGESTQQ